jgi:Actinobacteria/chloroflexi VLRF1 release factor
VRPGLEGQDPLTTRRVLLPHERLVRWVENFEARHGPTSLVVRDSRLAGSALDGSTFWATLPFAAAYDGPASAAAFAAAAQPPSRWGVLLVRKGGFAMALLAGAELRESKAGQRHVQGRTKAGGQSQQRFSRRRDNQARQAFEAAADHAVRILGDLVTEGGPLVVGGDRVAVDEVLQDRRLSRLEVVAPWLAVADPRRAVLLQAILDAQSVTIEVTNA